MTRLATKAPKPGRPRKFNRPSTAVTLTLPDDIIAALETIDRDLSRAIVRAVQPLVKKTPSPLPELSRYGRAAVIIVPSNAALRERTGVELIPLIDGRALIAFGDDLSAFELELRIQDALADSAFQGVDRNLFEGIVDILRDARRGNGLTLERRNIIVLRWPK